MRETFFLKMRGNYTGPESASADEYITRLFRGNSERPRDYSCSFVDFHSVKKSKIVQ